MKSKIILTIVHLIMFAGLFAQDVKPDKPSIILFPSEQWCISRGFYKEFENQGSLKKVADYRRAFQESSDLLLVISTINGIMADRGFPIENLESVLKSIESDNAEDNMRISSRTGAVVDKSSLDYLKSKAKADIEIQLTWTINTIGPKKSITFNLQGFDFYNNTQIATAAGTGAQSFSSELPVLLSEAVNSHMEQFTYSLQQHFDDLLENGRSILVKIKVWDDWEEDLLSEFGEDDLELGEIIQYWLDDNTVKGRNVLSIESENQLVFKNVRIPLFYKYKDKIKALDAKKFGSKLRKYLKNEFGIESLREADGLGKVTLFLGHK